MLKPPPGMKVHDGSVAFPPELKPFKHLIRKPKDSQMDIEEILELTNFVTDKYPEMHGIKLALVVQVELLKELYNQNLLMPLTAPGQSITRDTAPGHFVGSALVMDNEGELVLLVMHKKLGRWLPPGGHVELKDQGALERTAFREAVEETGLKSLLLHPWAPRPFDTDVHWIPATEKEAAHLHMDLRFLANADPNERAGFQEEEVDDCVWHTWEEVIEKYGAKDPSLARLVQKGHDFLKLNPGKSPT